MNLDWFITPMFSFFFLTTSSSSQLIYLNYRFNFFLDLLHFHCLENSERRVGYIWSLGQQLLQIWALCDCSLSEHNSNCNHNYNLLKYRLLLFCHSAHCAAAGHLRLKVVVILNLLLPVFLTNNLLCLRVLVKRQPYRFPGLRPPMRIWLLVPIRNHLMSWRKK